MTKNDQTGKLQADEKDEETRSRREEWANSEQTKNAKKPRADKKSESRRSCGSAESMRVGEFGISARMNLQNLSPDGRLSFAHFTLFAASRLEAEPEIEMSTVVLRLSSPFSTVLSPLVSSCFLFTILFFFNHAYSCRFAVAFALDGRSKE